MLLRKSVVDVLAKSATAIFRPTALSTGRCQPHLTESTDASKGKQAEEQNITSNEDRVTKNMDSTGVIDYSYFHSVLSDLGETSNVISKEVSKDIAVHKKERKLVNLKSVKPMPITKSATLAAYANQNETLKKMVQLGVDLSVVEKNAEAANHILKADFSQMIQPYLWYLNSLKVANNDLGHVITKAPKILMVEMDNLQMRVNYLQSKQFSEDAIGRIISKAPEVLLMPVKELDTKMGVLQKIFQLTGNEVRYVVTRYPKIATWRSVVVQEIYTSFDKVMGFSSLDEQKKLLMALPKLYLSNRQAIEKRFDYLHNTMGITHKQIVDWPPILRSRIVRFKPRHLFLQSIGRAQYNPDKENYISLKSLVSGTDSEFCKNVAKCPTNVYNDFLKTI